MAKCLVSVASTVPGSYHILYYCCCFYYYLESHCTVQAELELAFHKASLCYSLPSTGNTGWATIMPSSHICHNL